MQVYEAKNHTKETDEQNVTKNQTQNESKHSENENTNGNSLKNSAQRQQQSSVQDDDLLDGQDKRSKISKIKAGLKLNIKKFSLQHNEPAQKQEQKKEPQPKQIQVSYRVKKHQSSLEKDEILELLNFFAENINIHSELMASEVKKHEKNNETEIGALINKLLMILANKIQWPGSNETNVVVDKQNFISEIEKIFPYFKFEEICKKYSVTLATTKHPNASAKEKTNPQLTFTTQFFKIYQIKKQQSPVKQKEKPKKDLEFSDSDFKSDEEEIHAVKCSIEDFKKFTGFMAENKSPIKSDTVVTQQTQQIKKQVEKKVEVPNKQETVVQEKDQKKQDNEKPQSPVQKTSEEQKNQQKEKKNEKKENKKTGEEKEGKEQVIKQKKIPFEFYIKHQVILV